MGEPTGQRERSFDALVAAMDPAMVVVTVAGGSGEVDGCLVGFHSQSSIEPRRYTVWLSVANRTFRLARSASHLAVHVLAEGDGHMAEHFGGATGDEVDKLAGVGWSAGPGGVPLLEGLPARFVGRVVERLELPPGDHVGFVLEPVEVGTEAPSSPHRLSQDTAIEPGHPA